VPRSVSLTALFAVSAIAGSIGPACAGDAVGVDASCTDSPASCTVSAANSTGPGSQPGSGAAAGPPSSGASGAAQVTCTDAPYFPTSADQSAVNAQHPPNSGHYVVRSCSTGPDDPLPTRTLVWIANGAPALPDPQVLAAQAESTLALPNPTLDSSPAVGVPQVVQLPTWVWLPAAQWAAQSATASVPGESITASASPVSVSLSWGDGTTSTCQGPGTPFVAGVSNPAAESPNCGHTYLVTSAGAPGGQFAVTATLAWAISWSGGGTSGTFPDLTTSSTVRWSVAQIQAIQVNPGS
jgi:hypothetical protein